MKFDNNNWDNIFNCSTHLAPSNGTKITVIKKPKGNALQTATQEYIQKNKEQIVYKELNTRFHLEHPKYLKDILNTKPQVFGLKSVNTIREWWKGKQDTGWTVEDLHQLLVIPHTYPAFEINANTFRLPFSIYWKARLEGYRERIKRIQASVGRLFYRDRNGEVKTTSGFMIKDNLFICSIEKPNNVYNPLSNDQFRHIRPLWVNFCCDRFGSSINTFIVKEIVEEAPDKKPNVLLLRLDTQNQSQNKLPSALRLASSFSTPQIVLTLGYPSAIHPRHKGLVANHIFGSSQQMNVKQASPGHLFAIDDRKSSDHFVTHDCSTALGSSGSPIIDIKTEEVIGMHSHLGHSDNRNGIALSCRFLNKIIAYEI